MKRMIFVMIQKKNVEIAKKMMKNLLVLENLMKILKRILKVQKNLKKVILMKKMNLKKVHRLLVQKVERMVLFQIMNPNQKLMKISEIMKVNWYRMKQNLTSI